MGTCVNHPDRETSFFCMKNQMYLCEECLRCPDASAYCKFRSACPVWYVSREKAAWKQEEAERAPAREVFRVRFEPDGEEAEVPAGSTLLEAARAADVRLNASCNGKGVCGKCKLRVVTGAVDREPSPLLSEREVERNTVLACRARVAGDATVRIPEETLEKRLQVAGLGKEVTEGLRGLVARIDPLAVDVPLRMSPPTLEDSSSDLDRLTLALSRAGFGADDWHVGLDVIRSLAAAVRAGNWDVTASVIRNGCAREVVEVLPGRADRRTLGIAVDIGTTSIVVYLVDMADGTVLAATSGHNRQAACGDDVINRIVCSERDGVNKLSRMVTSTINGLIAEALDSTRTAAEQIRNVAVSGNTVMAHLFLGIDPRHIRREPYVPTASAYPVLRAGELGLRTDPRAAVFIMPGPAGYVGGDIVAGVLHAGLHRQEPVTLFVDVGTNGEIVLGNRDWIMTASCSAGPAFEGGGVRWGMRAEEGAIERVSLDPGSLEAAYQVVGGGRPRGLCGSGMIELLSEMHRNRVIDAAGKVLLDPAHPRVRRDRYGTAFLVAPAENTAVGEDIVVTEADIDNIVRSKGAVFAGFRVLLREAGLEAADLDRVWIAGGFGRYLDIEQAICIGMLPDIRRDKFRYLGNSAIAGTYLALLSGDLRREAATVSRAMTYVDFSSNKDFMAEYTSALFLPHTDLNLFPTVKERAGR